MNPVLDILLTAVVGVLLIGGAFWMLTAALSMFHARDSISRINVLSPATGLGLPMIVLGAFVQHTRENGFDPMVLLKTLLTVLALIIVSSVASNVLSRSAYLSGSPVDPRTAPQDLAPEGPETETEAEQQHGLETRPKPEDDGR